MTGEITIAPTVNIPPPASSPSSSGSQGTSQSSSDNTQNQQVQGQSTSSSQQQNNNQTNSASSSTDNNNNSNNTSSTSSGSGSGSTKFSTVLAASQSGGASKGATAGQSSQGQSSQGQPAQGQAASGSSGSGSASGTGTGTVVTSNITQLIVTLQAEMQSVVSTQGTDATGATDGQATASSQDNTLLQQLQQLLQQLTQEATTLTQSTQATGAAQASSGSGTGSNSKQGADNTSDNSMAQTLSQLLSVMNQITQQPDAQALSSDLNSMSVTSDGQSATAILAQLAQSIQNGLASAANGDKTTGTASSSAGATATGLFDNLVNSLMDSAKTDTGAGAGKDGSNADASTQDPTAQLQAALNDIVSIFSSVQNGTPSTPDASGSGSGNTNNGDNNSTNSTNANAVNPAIAPTINNAQISSADFVKLTAAAQPAPVADQVLVQIQNAVKTGANVITIQLSPQDLGKVNVSMVTNSSGQTNINITADNRNTLAMLQSEAQTLQQALRDVGLKTNMGGLSFSLGGGQQQNTSNFSNNQGGYTKVAAPVDDIDDSVNYGTTIASYQLSVQSGLNITV